MKMFLIVSITFAPWMCIWTIVGCGAWLMALDWLDWRGQTSLIFSYPHCSPYTSTSSTPTTNTITMHTISVVEDKDWDQTRIGACGILPEIGKIAWIGFSDWNACILRYCLTCWTTHQEWWKIIYVWINSCPNFHLEDRTFHHIQTRKTKAGQKVNTQFTFEFMVMIW